MGSAFIPGLKLSKIFFIEAVKPLLDKYYPTLQYDASLIGSGSEVLGYDDPISSDHHWGPRLQLFLSEIDYKNLRNEIDFFLREKLPYSIKGFSTHWTDPDPNDSGNQFLAPKSSGSVNHRVDIFSVRAYFKKVLNINSTDITDIDWLVLPEQRLLEFTSGEVYHHTLGNLTQARKFFSYYPENVWYFKLMSEWDHIAEEIAFVGRIGIRKDELGSKLVTARLVRYIVRLAYILNKKYVPYSKWYGYAFTLLPIATELQPILLEVLNHNNWRKREELLAKAYLILLNYMNSLQITPRIELQPIQYHSRDQIVVDVHSIIRELKKLIKPPLDKIKYPIGSIDQYIVDTHILTDSEISHKLKHIYF